MKPVTQRPVAVRAARPARLRLPRGQSALFAPDDVLPPGLRVAPEVIDTAAEAELIALAQRLPLAPARYQGYTARRRVWSFTPGGRPLTHGRHDPPHADPDPDPDAAATRGRLEELPPALQRLRERLGAWAGIDPRQFVHVMVAEYRPGTPLGWHRDAPMHGAVVGVSLAGPADLCWRPGPWTGWPDRRIVLALAPRSAYVMDGIARWQWQHSVPPVPALRWAVTLRTAAPVR
jgi:alkylated DNA repair dioxygenase AlkB